MGSNPGWKQYQREVCRFFSGEASYRGAGGSDCTGVEYAVEVKKIEHALPRSKDFLQAIAQGLSEKKPWILVTKPNRRKFDGAIVSMQMGTLRRLLEMEWDAGNRELELESASKEEE